MAGGGHNGMARTVADDYIIQYNCTLHIRINSVCTKARRLEE